MTAPTPEKAPKVKRKDAYIARITVSIPLDMDNAESLGNAIKAVKQVGDELPLGADFQIASAALGKI